MAKIRDWAVERDLRALSAMRRTCVIDFLQWTDDGASRTYQHPRITRHGHRATMQHLRAADFLALPDAVAMRPIARLEVSVDFFPGRSSTRAEAPGLLANCFEALFRRLAPWNHSAIRSRVFAQGGPGTGRHAYLEPPPTYGPSGRLLLRHLDADERLNVPLRRPALLAGRWTSETVWYGDAVEPSWDHLPIQPAPGAQVRLYCKTTDSGRTLPQSEWRVRVEVTLNGARLAQEGVINVGHIDQRTLTAMVSKFILLGQATGRKLPAPPRRDGSMARWMSRELHRRASIEQQHALERAPVEGLIATLPHNHLVKFKTVPELMKMVRVPAADFFKPQRRAR